MKQRGRQTHTVSTKAGLWKIMTPTATDPFRDSWWSEEELLIIVMEERREGKRE